VNTPLNDVNAEERENSITFEVDMAGKQFVSIVLVYVMPYKEIFNLFCQQICTKHSAKFKGGLLFKNVKC
jgi:hypothetical protein